MEVSTILTDPSKPTHTKFYRYLNDLKNLEHLDEEQLRHIQEMSCEQKMMLIITLNEVMISLKELL
jgi:hypothetical protein